LRRKKGFMDMAVSFDLLKGDEGFLSELCVHKMTRMDLEEVVKIEKASFPSPWPEEAFIYEMENGLSRLFVARGKKGKTPLVGYICFWIVVDECHILNIATHPEFRRKKVASLLLTHTFSQCKKCGVRRVFLEVRRGNIPARSLYMKFGFSIDHIRKDYYKDTREDALVMELFI